MREIIRTTKFQRDVKACKRRHWDMETFKDAVARLAMSDEEPVPIACTPRLLGRSIDGRRGASAGQLWRSGGRDAQVSPGWSHYAAVLPAEIAM